jgi:hypothetical protein
MVGRGAGSGRMKARLRRETRSAQTVFSATGEAGASRRRTSTTIVDNEEKVRAQYGCHENARGRFHSLSQSKQYFDVKGKYNELRSLQAATCVIAQDRATRGSTDARDYPSACF